MNFDFTPLVQLNFESKGNDLVYHPFSILDDNNSPLNFSGFTSGKMTLRGSELGSEIISFTSTGATYSIDISLKTTGYFVVKGDKLAIDAGTYLFDFVLKNATQKLTLFTGKYSVLPDITL